MAAPAKEGNTVDGGHAQGGDLSDIACLSRKVDKQQDKLKAFLDGSYRATEEDAATISAAIGELRAKADHAHQLFARIEALIADDRRELATLFDTLHTLVSPLDEASHDMVLDEGPCGSQRGGEASSLQTPPTYGRAAFSGGRGGDGHGEAATTPRSASRRAIDYDAYPSTPTLEQLGLSRAALDLVGGDRNKNKPNSTIKNAAFGSSSDFDSEVGGRLRSSLGSTATSLATPLMTNMQSLSSSLSAIKSGTGLSMHAADGGSGKKGASATASGKRKGSLLLQSTIASQLSSTPTVKNSPGATSPFGGTSSTIFGGRPSDAFSSTLNSDI